MKNTIGGSFITINRKEMENLTSEVAETLAFEHSLLKAKTFTSADLWNIQRQAKARGCRRYM